MTPLPDIIDNWIIHSRDLFYSRARRSLAAAQGLQEQNYDVYLPVGKGVKAAVKAPEGRENGCYRFGGAGDCSRASVRIDGGLSASPVRGGTGLRFCRAGPASRTPASP